MSLSGVWGNLFLSVSRQSSTSLNLEIYLLLQWWYRVSKKATTMGRIVNPRYICFDFTLHTYVLLNISKSLILLILEFRRNRLICVIERRKEERKRMSERVERRMAGWGKIYLFFILEEKELLAKSLQMKHVCNLKSIRLNEYILLLNILVASIIQYCLKYKKHSTKFFFFFAFFCEKYENARGERIFDCTQRERIRWCRRTLSIVYWHFGVLQWGIVRGRTWLSEP